MWAEVLRPPSPAALLTLDREMKRNSRGELGEDVVGWLQRVGGVVVVALFDQITADVTIGTLVLRERGGGR